MDLWNINVIQYFGVLAALEKKEFKRENIAH